METAFFNSFHIGDEVILIGPFGNGTTPVTIVGTGWKNGSRIFFHDHDGWGYPDEFVLSK